MINTRSPALATYAFSRIVNAQQHEYILLATIIVATGSVWNQELWAGSPPPIVYTASVSHHAAQFVFGDARDEDPLNLGVITAGVSGSSNVYLDTNFGFVDSTIGLSVDPGQATVTYDMRHEIARVGRWPSWEFSENASEVVLGVWVPVGDTLAVSTSFGLNNNGYGLSTSKFSSVASFPMVETPGVITGQAVAGGRFGSIEIDGITYGQLPELADNGYTRFRVSSGYTNGPRVYPDLHTLNGLINIQAENLSRVDEPCDCLDVLRDSVTPMDSSDGLERGQVSASFQPKYKGQLVSIEEAKSLCEVEQFRWINRIQSEPSNMKTYRVVNPIEKVVVHKKTGKLTYLGEDPEETRLNYEPADFPLIDPIVPSDGNAEFYFTTVYSPETEEYALTVYGTEDELPFYYNLPWLPIPIDFTDRPYLFPGAYLPGGRRVFETSLVGVKEDGEIIEWSGVGTNFTWYSDSEASWNDVIINGDAYVSGGKAIDFDGDIVRGDSYILSTDLVPEPTTVSLLSLALLTLTALAPDRRRWH